MATYDPKVLYEFANRLYSRASQTIATSTILGALLGGSAGYLIGHAAGVYTLVGAVILGLIGYSIGTERAFQLKLQAQTALCQVKIEENTRRA